MREIVIAGWTALIVTSIIVGIGFLATFVVGYAAHIGFVAIPVIWAVLFVLAYIDVRQGW